MASIVLQQVSSKYARDNEGRPLAKPVALKYLRGLPEDQANKLEELFPAGRAYLWGSKFERVHQYGKMPPHNTLVLFRRGRVVYKCGVVLHWLWNEHLAENLWGRDDDGETWSLVFFLNRLHDISLEAATVNQLLGRKASDNWQGFTAVMSDECEEVIRLVKAQIPKPSNP